MNWVAAFLLLAAMLPPARAESPSTVVGNLVVTSIDSTLLGKPRTLRIWLPPGYDADPAARFKVLYLHDGQNCFDVKTSAFGKEWRIDETFTQAIAARRAVPLIVVAIDNGGAERLNEFTFDADPKHGGGGAEKYAGFLLSEVMTWIEQHYRVATGPQNTYLCGSSLGGLVSLEIVRRHPGMFGHVFAFSPSVWWNDQSLRRAVEKDAGGLADAHVMLTVGERENFKSIDDPENKQTVAQVRAFYDALGRKQNPLVEFKDQESMISMIVFPDGVHDENAWSRIIPQMIGSVRSLRPTTQP